MIKSILNVINVLNSKVIGRYCLYIFYIMSLLIFFITNNISILKEIYNCKYFKSYYSFISLYSTPIMILVFLFFIGFTLLVMILYYIKAFNYMQNIYIAVNMLSIIAFELFIVSAITSLILKL